MPLLKKKHIKLGHAGIMDRFIDTRFFFLKCTKRKWTEAKKEKKKKKKYIYIYIKQSITSTTPNTLYVSVSWRIPFTATGTWGQQRTSGPAEHISSPTPSWRRRRSVVWLTTWQNSPTLMTPNLAFLRSWQLKLLERERSRLDCEDYWPCNLRTIFKGMNSRNDLKSVFSCSSR